MASITIRDLPDKTKEALRVHAARSGVSLEAYTRHILKQASEADLAQPINILTLAEKYFGPGHGVELDLPSRRSHRRPVDFQ